MMQALTVPELTALINRKFAELKPYSLKPFSRLNSKLFREFITLCTSISIKYMQYDLLTDTLVTLIKASEADKLLSDLGSSSEQFWQGRLLTFHTLAFLYYRTQQFKKSLKVLHDGQQIIELILSSKQYLCPDFNLASNLLIFMNLWKVRKIKECKDYLELTKNILNQISRFSIKSKLSSLSRQNLNGLLSLASAGISYWEKDRKKAGEICEQTLGLLVGDEVMVRPLIYGFMKKAKNLEVLDTDWVTSKEFDSIVLVSCFLPYIAVGTPFVKVVTKTEVNNTSRTSSGQSSRRNRSVPLSRLQVGGRERRLVQKKVIRRGSDIFFWPGNRVEKKANKSFDHRTGSGKVYSPSISSLTTPRSRRLENRAATMTELPLELIKGMFYRPLSSK